MTEYMISVSLNGTFLFRTTWSGDRECVALAANLFATRLGIGVKVQVYSREAAMATVDFRSL